MTPVAILHLLKKTNPSALLVSGQVSHSVKETIEVYESQKPENFVLPQIVDSLSYEEFLYPKSDLAEYPTPPRYPLFFREDLGAFIMHSSGTTGLPKPISHSQAYPLIFAACHRFSEQNEPFRYQASTLPLYHVCTSIVVYDASSDVTFQGYGLLATTLSLSIGLPFILPPATVIPTGKSTLAMLKASGARYLLSVPSILEDILRLPGKYGLEALQELEVVAIGGAAMKENVGAELVANGVNLLNHWGGQLCRICISPSLNLSLLRCYRDRCYCSYRAYPPWIRLALSHASYRYRPSICPNGRWEQYIPLDWSRSWMEW